MPLIQHKVIDGNLIIVTFEKRVDVVADKFLKINEIVIDNEKPGFKFLKKNHKPIFISKL